MKRLLSCLAFTLALVLPQAHAALIATDQAASDRAHVMALIARPEVARELEKMGIAREEAAARVAAMSDAEVRELAGRLDAVPGGGQVSTQNLLLIIILILLLAFVI